MILHPDYPTIDFKPAIARYDWDQTYDVLEFMDLPKGMSDLSNICGIPAYEQMVIERFTPDFLFWADEYSDKLFNFLKNYNFSPNSSIQQRIVVDYFNQPIVINSNLVQISAFDFIGDTWDSDESYEVNLDSGTYAVTFLLDQQGTIATVNYFVPTINKVKYIFEVSGNQIIDLNKFINLAIKDEIFEEENGYNPNSFVSCSLVLNKLVNNSWQKQTINIQNQSISYDNIDSYLSNLNASLTSYFIDVESNYGLWAQLNDEIQVSAFVARPQRYLSKVIKNLNRTVTLQTNITPEQYDVIINRTFTDTQIDDDFTLVFDNFPLYMKEHCFLIKANNNRWSQPIVNPNNLGVIPANFEGNNSLQVDWQSVLQAIRMSLIQWETLQSQMVVSNHELYALDGEDTSNYFNNGQPFGDLWGDYKAQSNLRESFNIDGYPFPILSDDRLTGFLSGLFENYFNWGQEKYFFKTTLRGFQSTQNYCKQFVVTIKDLWLDLNDATYDQTLAPISTNPPFLRGEFLMGALMLVEFDAININDGLFDCRFAPSAYTVVNYGDYYSHSEFYGVDIAPVFPHFHHQVKLQDVDSTATIQTLEHRAEIYNSTEWLQATSNNLSDDDMLTYLLNEKSITEAIMVDSVLMKNIGAAIGADEFSYYLDGNGDPQPYFMNIARRLDWLAKAYGVAFNPDGSIISVRQRVNVPVTLNTQTNQYEATVPDGWSRGQFADNKGGNTDINEGQTGGLSTEERLGIAYQQVSNTYDNYDSENDENNTYKEGDIVLCDNFLQFFECFLEDLDKGLDWQEMSAGIIPSADGTRFCKFEGLGQLLAECAFMLSTLSGAIYENRNLGLQALNNSQFLIKATGLPIVNQNLKIKTGEKDELGEEIIADLPLPQLKEDAPSLTQQNYSIIENLALLLGKAQQIEVTE